MTPWELNPFALISWWQMQRFSAVLFFSIGRYLSTARKNLKAGESKEGNSRDTVLTAMSDESGDHQVLAAVKGACQQIGLTISTKSTEAVLRLREKGTTIGAALDAIGVLEQTIAWEMEDRLFMYVDPERAARFNQPELFGKDVNAKFPNIQFDVVEAGNCYATGRSTAVVFHLMRIMETGVQAFGTELGVALADEKNWQNILDEIDKAIKVLPKTPQRVEMSQTSANLYAVKLAWRNEVMHPNDTYTLEEADNLIRQVKIFMEQLATIV